ncbi:putative mediator of rna polymerase [Podospora conica]|nr:putative mediator of rna polymerase [Schizothecium conicum]
MADRLTQLQEAADELANQFIACFYYLERRHDLEPFGPNDKIPDLKPEQPKEVDSLPPDVFQAGMVELARDLILKEQQMEYLISNLPGLDNSEREQEQLIKDLEEELKVAEAQRLEAVKEKQEVLAKLNQVLRGIRRH